MERQSSSGEAAWWVTWISGSQVEALGLNGWVMKVPDGLEKGEEAKERTCSESLTRHVTDQAGRWTPVRGVDTSRVSQPKSTQLFWPLPVHPAGSPGKQCRPWASGWHKTAAKVSWDAPVGTTEQDGGLLVIQWRFLEAFPGALSCVAWTWAPQLCSDHDCREEGRKEASQDPPRSPERRLS